MQAIWIIFKRELSSYFTTPIAYVFIIIFLVLTSVFTFYLGQFFNRNQADLLSFFNFLPWIYLLFIPALAMRLWSEEFRSGTIELLLTLPIQISEAVLGKFFAAFIFICFSIGLTFPLWITVNYLGSPDNGTIVAGYLGAILMASSFLAISSCISALTRNQVTAFIVSMVICLLFLLSGLPLVLDFFTPWAPMRVIDLISSFSFLSHFQLITKGVLDLSSIIYFLSLTIFWLFANTLCIELKKGSA